MERTEQDRRSEELDKYECNDCPWTGNDNNVEFDDMDNIPICPDCGSENIYQNF